MRHHSDVHVGGGGNDRCHRHAANHCRCRRLLLYAWVFSVFLMAQAATTVTYGRLADTFGRRPTLIVGLSIFLVGSLMCGFAWSMPLLIIFRAIQDWRRLNPADRQYDYRRSLRPGRTRHDSRLLRLSLGHCGYHRSAYRKYHCSTYFMVMDFLAEYSVLLANNSWADPISAGKNRAKATCHRLPRCGTVRKHDHYCIDGVDART
jgi:hypothetical protein